MLTKVHFGRVEGSLAFGRGASCHGLDEVNLELGEVRARGLDYL